MRIRCGRAAAGLLLCVLTGCHSYILGDALAEDTDEVDLRPFVEEQGIRTELRVPEVEAPDGSLTRCESFLGSFPGYSLRMQANGSAGDGNYLHVLVYYVYGRRYQEVRIGNGEFHVKLPALADDAGSLALTFYLFTRDGTGKGREISSTYTVTRPIVLSASAASHLSCIETFLPYLYRGEIRLGGTVRDTLVSLKRGVDEIWNSTQAWDWGVYVAPFVFGGFDRLVNENWGYFRQVSRQTRENVMLQPGFWPRAADAIRVYAQPVRFVTAYDATLVDACGGAQKQEGAYLFQWWGFNYRVVPASQRAPEPDSPGAPVENTCPADLSSEARELPVSPYTFVRTN